MVSQHGLKCLQSLSEPAVDNIQSWVFQNVELGDPQPSICSDETNPLVVRAIRRQIHSFILGTDK